VTPPQAREPLLRALHDLALCRAAGWPDGAGAGLARLRGQLREEALEDAPLRPEGAKDDDEETLIQEHYTAACRHL
jgi:hypothetical protein